jgi:pentatricopeptide repeat protein
MKSLVKSNKLQEAKEFFSSIQDPDIEDWNQMLKISKTTKEANELFDKMVLNVVPNEYTLTYLLNCYLKNNEINNCEVLMSKMENEFHVMSNAVHYSALMHAYSKIKDIHHVEEVLEKMKAKNIELDAIGFHVLIRGYINTNHFDKAQQTFQNLQDLNIYSTQQQLTYYKAQHLC